MHLDDPTPLQPADPEQGWPRVEARPDPGGVTLLAFPSERDVRATSAVGLTRAGAAAFVRWYARRYPARFEELAKEEICAAWRGALDTEVSGSGSLVSGCQPETTNQTRGT